MQPLYRSAKSALILITMYCALTNALAAEYPDRAIKILVGFPAGQSSDANARRIAAGMSTILKQTVFVDNKAGAAGAIAHGALKHSAPDGYTLAIGSTGTLAINPFLYKSLPYDPLRDFEPVGLISASPLVLAVPATSPFNNLKDLLAYAKAHPGKLAFASGGNGSTGHIAMEMLKKQTGIDVLHVPYKGSPPMITDLMGGQVEVAFDPIGSMMPFIKSGKMKSLGIATLARYAPAPEMPTLVEQGVAGFEAVPWTVLLAPKGTPVAVLQVLNTALVQVLKEPTVVEDFARTASMPLGGTAAAATQYLRTEQARWGVAVKASGAQVD
jgi:tripartite-type tricarboxylate transporter receptor subunit TctC